MLTSVVTANAAVLFPDTFRIVLRAAKAEGRQTYEAVLVSDQSLASNHPPSNEKISISRRQC